jgi:hypothetical protein
MRSKEFISELFETTTGQLRIGDMTIEVDGHSFQQTIKRFVSPLSVDKVLKKFETVSDQIAEIPNGHKFWVFDEKNDVAVGMRCLDAEHKRYKLMTVVGNKPWDGPTPVINTP